MGGGLMQLVAYGAQDVYLTSNPQITFWKVTYRRYTNFAMESIEQTFNGQADFGRRVTCTISRNGDLAYRTYLQIVLPEINQSMGKDNQLYARWLDHPGEQIVETARAEQTLLLAHHVQQRRALARRLVVQRHRREVRLVVPLPQRVAVHERLRVL